MFLLKVFKVKFTSSSYLTALRGQHEILKKMYLSKVAPHSHRMHLCNESPSDAQQVSEANVAALKTVKSLSFFYSKSHLHSTHTPSLRVTLPASSLYASLRLHHLISYSHYQHYTTLYAILIFISYQFFTSTRKHIPFMISFCCRHNTAAKYGCLKWTVLTLLTIKMIYCALRHVSCPDKIIHANSSVLRL